VQTLILFCKGRFFKLIFIIFFYSYIISKILLTLEIFKKKESRINIINKFLLVLKIFKKKESGINITSRFLLVLKTFKELTLAFIRLVEIY
jgi:hypothetical protein